MLKLNSSQIVYTLYIQFKEKEKMRQVFSIRISPEVWTAAHKKGLNISQICEQTLKTAVQKGGNLGTVGSGMDWGGFEPPASAVRGRHSSKLNYQPSACNSFCH